MAGMRQWTRLRNETSSGTIRLATYNILAQHYVDTMPHLYQHCFRSKKSHLLQWINRKWFHFHHQDFLPVLIDIFVQLVQKLKMGLIWCLGPLEFNRRFRRFSVTSSAWM